jgi:hypothetical protein
MSKAITFITSTILLIMGFNTVAQADCGTVNDKRSINVSQSPNLVVGDTWNGNGGVIAMMGLCGGCAIVNYGGAYPNPAYQTPSAKIEWGDGTSSALTIRANDGALLGSHTYKTAVNAGAIKITASGHCVNTQRNWDESVDNNCSNIPTLSMCEPHAANVSVFSPMQPTSFATTNTPIKHGTVNSGALVVSLDSAAPASGMIMQVSSPNAKVKFANRGQASSNPAYILVPATKVSVDFDLDLKSVTAPSRVTISTVNKNDPQPDKTKTIQIQIQ